MARTLDELSLMEEFLSQLPQQIKKDLSKGMTSKQLQEKYAPMAAARIASIALTDADSSKALAAAKDMLDRVFGKATEKKEISHKLETLSDEELNASLLTALSDEDIDADYELVDDKVNEKKDWYQ